MSTSYTVSRDQIIVSALRKLNVLEIGDTPDADTTSNAAFVLNLLLKMWATDGLKLWTIEEWTMPLVANTTRYTLGPGTSTGVKVTNTGALTYDKPLKIVQAFLRNTTVTPNLDIPMQTLSQQEYMMLGLSLIHI